MRRLKQRKRECGSIEPRPTGGWRHGYFDPVRLEQLEAWLRQHPDATLEWMPGRVQLEMRLRCSLMAVCRAIKKLGGSLKKTLRADERDRPDVVRQRTNFVIARRFADLERFVFLDESSAKTNMTRLVGRAPVGQQAIEEVGASLWYLPPYSPDLNPIEKLWAKVKAWLRRVAARSIEHLIHAVGDVLRTVDADECRTYLRSCGYATVEC